MSSQVFRLPLLLVAALAAIGSASAAPAAPALTLEECIARALDQNFTLRIQSFDAANARETLTASEAGFDPTLTLRTSRSFSQADVAATTLTGTRSELSDTRLGVSQRLTTGATVSLSGSLNRNETNNTFSTLNPAYNADVSLSISQPLLRNAGPAANKAAINRAELGVTRAGHDFRAQVLTVVRNTEAAYYNLVFAREQLKVRRMSLALAERLFEENKTRKNTGVATDLDVLQAEVGVANARRSVLEAEKVVRDRQDDLLALIGRFEFDTVLGEVSLPSDRPAVPDFAASYGLARENQPEYRSAQAAIGQLELDLITARNAHRPSLDLGGAVGHNTRDRSTGRALNRLPDGDGYNWQVDLSLSMPWGMRGDKARLRIAQNNLEREQARLQQIEQNLLAQVRAAVRAVETNLESADISAKATELSVRQYELEKARFDAGLSTSRLVLEAQDALERARVSELQALVNLRTAVADLRRLEGSSLARYNIRTDE
ncbi:MAG: TolC family protein [Opitutaceae bacterium]|nr:TolC family protein [Opitutaceae bacterium]